MYTKFTFNTIDNSEMDWDEGEERDLKFLADLSFQYHEANAGCIYIDYSYNKFTDDEDADMKDECLGKISLEEARKLIRALQFMTEGK